MREAYAITDESDDGDPYVQVYWPVVAWEGTQYFLGIFEPTQDFGITEQI